MPTYTLDLTIPANTPEISPIEKELEIKEGVITRISVLIPGGHLALAGFRLLYGIEPIFPAQEAAWIKGNDESFVIDEWWDLVEEPCRLRVQGYNTDETFDHTFYIRIIALPRKVALAHQLYLKRLGKEIASAFARMAGYV